MTNLLAALATIRPREKSGSWTSARYDFQRHVAILKIIDLHDRGQDYRIGFDYLDDLFILDSSSNPKKLRFLQIKSRSSGCWTMRSVTTHAKHSQSPRSIIGKLYLNAFHFPNMTDMITFVSNAPFRFDLASGRTTNDDDLYVLAECLSDTACSEIDNYLDVDFAQPRLPAWRDILSFERIILSVHEQRRDVVGRLCEYFASHHGDDTAPTMALYESLFAEVSRRTGISHNFCSLADFFRQKTLSRPDIDHLFNHALAPRRFYNVWSILQRDLSEAGYTSFQQIDIQTYCIEYILERAKGAPLAARLSARARQAATRVRSTLAQCDNAVAAALALKLCLPEDGDGEHEELQVLAALIVEAYEAPR